MAQLTLGGRKQVVETMADPVVEINENNRVVGSMTDSCTYKTLKPWGCLFQPSQRVLSCMPEYRFTCPECDARALVDGGVRERLLSVGCPVCSCPVGRSAFDEGTSFGDDHY